MVPFGGWDMPVEYSGLDRRAQRRPHRRRPVRRVPHGASSRSRATGAARLPAAGHLERRGEARGRPGAVLGPAHAERLPGRRRHRVPAVGAALPGGRQRRERREGLELAAGPVALGVRAAQPERRVRAPGPPGAEGRGDPPGPHPDRPRSSVAFYRFAEGRVGGAEAIVARTGYTGEDGFEIFVRSRGAPRPCGERSSRRASPTACCPPASGLATRCASRPG